MTSAVILLPPVLFGIGWMLFADAPTSHAIINALAVGVALLLARVLPAPQDQAYGASPILGVGLAHAMARPPHP